MTDAPAQRGGQPTKARVFISYSRKDIAFADRLDGALRAKFTLGYSTDAPIPMLMTH